tara:strand:+ start:256 stop:531 length:276 start_codon:yes stop_codon:yes gene_type:complete
MEKQPYKYQVLFNNIQIVEGNEIGYNVFDNLNDAKKYACNSLYGVNKAEHPAYKERIRLITKQELFDDLFRERNELRDYFISQIPHGKEDK